MDSRIPTGDANRSTDSDVGLVRLIWRYLLRQRAAAKAAWLTRQRDRSRHIILGMPPAAVDPDAKHEIHALTCERDYSDLLWCLKSLFHFADIPFDVIIHDDGSLTPQALRHLQTHLRGATIVPRCDADKRLNAALDGHPACRAFRNCSPLAKKVFDFPEFAKRDHYLMLDSDILFFARPDQLIRLLDCGTHFFMSDYQNGYVFSASKIAEKYGVHVLPCVNTGIASLSRDMYDYQFIEKFASDLDAQGLLAHGWSEQTMLAIAFSKLANPATRLSEAYSVSHRRIDHDTISHHFVGDGSRDLFYTKGLAQLRRSGFRGCGVA